jgi:hypothetical protein
MYQFGIRIALGGNSVVTVKAEMLGASSSDAPSMTSVPLKRTLRRMLRKSSGSPRFL